MTSGGNTKRRLFTAACVAAMVTTMLIATMGGSLGSAAQRGLTAASFTVGLLFLAATWAAYLPKRDEETASVE